MTQLLARIIALTLSGVVAGFGAHECSNADFVGKYAFQGFGDDIRMQPPTPMALSGSLEADGAGGFLFWDNTVAMLQPPDFHKVVISGDLLDAAAEAGSVMRYEVTPSCRIRIFGVVQTPFGPSPLELTGGLADGGRKAIFQMGMPFAIGTWTAESAQPSPLKNLLERIANRLSLRP